MSPSWLSKSLLATLLSVTLANAAFTRPWRGLPPLPKIPVDVHPSVAPDGTALPPLTTVYQFSQLIDHNNKQLGTFQQRYWMNWEFYKTGGPIVLMTPGEADGDGYTAYLTNQTMPGMIAQQQNGATVILEHRFYGNSNPYNNLTSQSLAVHTVEQAVEDLAYFAKTVNLPMPGGDQVKPNQVPWVLAARSYAGALVSWTRLKHPDVFYAAYASSAVVEAITNFYDLFTPIREYMPKNCSADVEAVIGYLDTMHASNNKTALQSLQTTFGLENLTHIEDFASALQANMIDWQLLTPTSAGGMFYQFCDALEVKDGVKAPASGWGLAHAIQAWGNFWKTTYYSNYCGDSDAESCLGTYDPNSSFYTDVSINNTWRSWFWIVCNQLGFLQDGPPAGQPAIVSRLIQPVYFERQCVDMFPQKFKTPPTPGVNAINKNYEGWNIKVDRVFFANGLRDHWRDATVSADGLHKANTTMQPIYLTDAFHGSDMIAANAKVDPSVLTVQKAGLAHMKTWLSTWSA
ncbi:peptidase S28 [Hygrophoropsis aurantiaca]|uniref:Peptidase S28 n=1 Tax=Hygrophoropsis aurantiaca TaxID=72124 RepID=A0ACB8ASL1_9AGAM|nr:peptidase S28 [Hygrophoropsis aurantiaca]